MPNPDNAIILMAKNPEAGKVKTRLASDLGEEEALKVYIHLLQKTLHTALQVDSAALYIFHSPKIIKKAEWIPKTARHQQQSKGDLGRRMLSAAHNILDSHNKVIIIGADCPGLNPNYLEKAFNNLDKVDVVIGPTEDGGYYLIGLMSPRPYLLENMKWSKDDVYHTTIDRMSRHGDSVYILPELYDIDYLEDWKRFQKEL